MTLLLTTHDLPDVERLCRRLVVQLVEPSAALDGLPGVLGVTVEVAGLRQRLVLSPSQATAATLIAEVASRVAVRDLTLAEPSIEDLVRTLYAS